MRKFLITFADDDPAVIGCIDKNDWHYAMGIMESYNDGSHYFYYPDDIQEITDEER